MIGAQIRAIPVRREFEGSGVAFDELTQLRLLHHL